MVQFSCPAQPQKPENSGIERNLIINLIAKMLSVYGVMTPARVSQEIKLSKSIVKVLLDEMITLQLVESRGLEGGDVRSDIRYALTLQGNARVLEVMQQSQYLGPAPVPLSDFVHQVELQSIKHEEIHREELTSCLSHLVLSDTMMLQLGPAANSARSVLLYGEPGNGKTSIAEALGGAFTDTIYIPYSIVVGNQIIVFFDETLHEPLLPQPLNGADGERLDPRWIACKRPVVVTGGELTLQMLDLTYNLQAKFYEAPVHLKALGGIFIIDDFGRQQTSPKDILNRWIIPLEKGHDYLSLHTGLKFSVPFDQLVVFSTNLLPEELSDGAALRRIYFKILIPSPTKEQYIEIFRRVCEEKQIEFSEQVVSEFFDEYYVGKRLVPSGAHPGFMLDHILAVSAYHGVEPELTSSLLELAWKNISASAAS